MSTPDHVIVVKVFDSDSLDPDTPAAEVVGEIHGDRITTRMTGDPEAVGDALVVLEIVTGDHPTERDGPVIAAGLGGVLLGAMLGHGGGD